MRNHSNRFDTTIEVVTPENIAFRYQVAGPFRRLPAYLIDLAIRVLIWIAGSAILAIVLGILTIGGSWWAGGSLILAFIITWFYGGLFETLWNGQTPGKRWMQIRVLSIDGQPINAVQGILRNVLRAADILPGCYQLGLLAALVSNRFQRLGDLAAGTMVVVEQRPWAGGRGLVWTAEPEVRRIAEQIPADFQASRSMARALATYVQRRQAFAWARRLEIAQHLGEPLRNQFGMPPNTNDDWLLCALYQRTFLTERRDEPVTEGSPFLKPHVEFAQPLPQKP
jgi:uncharacterized RDD family membrane protein YckC